VRRRAGILALVIACISVLVPTLGAPSQAANILVGRVHSGYNPSDGKIFVLVLGSDARFGNPDDVNADAIHIVGINTDTGRGGILNFPRDSYVSIPGRGSAKINEALLRGGPELVAQTLENLTGIRLDYWIMTGFDGFRGLMFDIGGGVEINLPNAIYDPGGSGANLEAGKQRLFPEAALSYVRTRKSLSGGDVARSTNQGTFLLALLRKLQHQVDYNPSTLFRWITATQKWTRLDVPPEELFNLGVLASQVDPKKIKNVTVPVSLGFVGAASVVFISPTANSIYADFRKNGAL
jgi:LCP family protein required for cell wall assembly